jgi:hypothetical protein
VVESLAAPVAPSSVHGRSTTVGAARVALLNGSGVIASWGRSWGGSRRRSVRGIIRDIRSTVPGVDPGDLLAVDGGGHHVANGTLLVHSSLSLDVADLLVATVEVLVAGATLVESGLSIALVTEAGSGDVVGELLEVQRATEMPGNLSYQLRVRSSILSF